MRLQEMDETSRTIIISIAGLVVFALSFALLKVLMAPTAQGHGTMMGLMSGGAIYYNTLMTSLALIAGAVAALIANLVIERSDNSVGKSELATIKRIISLDERKLIDEVEKAGDITQDSLRFRLGWSKAKISSILTNLDRARVVQRERQGKTYSISLEKKK